MKVAFSDAEIQLFSMFNSFTHCRTYVLVCASNEEYDSKSTVFEVCRRNVCCFRVNGRPIRHNFYLFQKVPASCKRSLCHCFTRNILSSSSGIFAGGLTIKHLEIR